MTKKRRCGATVPTFALAKRSLTCFIEASRTFRRLRLWWNWQTRYFEVVVEQSVQVQVLLSAPFFLRKLSKQVLLTENQPGITAETKFPKRIRHKGQTVTIYSKSKANPNI
jgi:hypothetical protein